MAVVGLDLFQVAGVLGRVVTSHRPTPSYATRSMATTAQPSSARLVSRWRRSRSPRRSRDTGFVPIIGLTSAIMCDRLAHAASAASIVSSIVRRRSSTADRSLYQPTCGVMTTSGRPTALHSGLEVPGRASRPMPPRTPRSIPAARVSSSVSWRRAVLTRAPGRTTLNASGPKIAAGLVEKGRDRTGPGPPLTGRRAVRRRRTRCSLASCTPWRVVTTVLMCSAPKAAATLDPTVP